MNKVEELRNVGYGTSWKQPTPINISQHKSGLGLQDVWINPPSHPSTIKHGKACDRFHNTTAISSPKVHSPGWPNGLIIIIIIFIFESRTACHSSRQQKEYVSEDATTLHGPALVL
jgi:hypothetical protein